MRLFFVFLFQISIAFSSPNSRIVGGEEAEPNSRPYAVQLMTEISKSATSYCGGSIIDKEWILTSASCIISPLQDGGLPVSGTTLVNVAEFIPHEEFNRTSTGMPVYDIGLIKLEEPLEFNESIDMIELSDTKLTASGTKVFVMGWGVTEETSIELSDVLMEVEMETISTDECKWPLVTEDQICLNAQKGHHNCHGDLGGPNVYEGKLVGVTSLALCAPDMHLPDISTSVAAHKQWIMDTMENVGLNATSSMSLIVLLIGVLVFHT